MLEKIVNKFKNLLGKSSTEKTRNLFEELFPLSKENYTLIESSIDNLITQMHGEEGAKALKEYKRDYKIDTHIFHSLEFDRLGWSDLNNEGDNFIVYKNEFGDAMTIEKLTPNGTIKKEAKSELLVYRNWLRSAYAEKGGGLISCEEFKTEDGLEGFESILKLPRENAPGMDYIYYLNMSNYEEQKLYQITINVFEMSPTGLRDNLIMHPISDITGLDLGELMGYYRQDPYGSNFKEGNIMNISEKREFDPIFKFHPLNIIREEIRPRVLKSVKFIA